jgi:hypothetical protein
MFTPEGKVPGSALGPFPCPLSLDSRSFLLHNGDREGNMKTQTKPTDLKPETGSLGSPKGDPALFADKPPPLDEVEDALVEVLGDITQLKILKESLAWRKGNGKIIAALEDRLDWLAGRAEDLRKTRRKLISEFERGV